MYQPTGVQAGKFCVWAPDTVPLRWPQMRPLVHPSWSAQPGCQGPSRPGRLDGSEGPQEVPVAQHGASDGSEATATASHACRDRTIGVHIKKKFLYMFNVF